VGAVAVLFLFVVMMLDIKIAFRNNDLGKFTPFIGFFLVVFCLVLEIIDFPITTSIFFLDHTVTHNVWFSIFDHSDGIQLLAYVLFVDYYVYILLAGFALLLALIGAVVLTLKFDNSLNHQIVSRQIARDANSAVFFIR
jgi:NADH-quinone oxidoreductase subunit J